MKMKKNSVSTSGDSILSFIGEHRSAIVLLIGTYAGVVSAVHMLGIFVRMPVIITFLDPLSYITLSYVPVALCLGFVVTICVLLFCHDQVIGQLCSAKNSGNLLKAGVLVNVVLLVNAGCFAYLNNTENWWPYIIDLLAVIILPYAFKKRAYSIFIVNLCFVTLFFAFNLGSVFFDRGLGLIQIGDNEYRESKFVRIYGGNSVVYDGKNSRLIFLDSQMNQLAVVDSKSNKKKETCPSSDSKRGKE